MRFHDNDHAAWVLEHGPACFVFGSNTAGTHGAGAARYARDALGFPLGVGEGHGGPGDSAYALPTLVMGPRGLEKPHLGFVEVAVRRFLAAAAFDPTVTYFVSAVGCGLAGFRDSEIAPLFRGAPENCVMPRQWEEYL